MPWKNGTPELYSVWRGMLRRCFEPKSKIYKYYGGRGITVCPQWRKDFKQFCADMGLRPKGLTLERVDNNRNYTPENCCWATRKAQSINRRVTRKVILDGKEYIASELAKAHGLATMTILVRVRAGLSYTSVVAKEPRRDLSGLKVGSAISSVQRKAKTHCKHGHEWTPKNTYITPHDNSRVCRACLAMWYKQRKRRRERPHLTC